MLTPKKNAINHGTMLGLMLGLSTTLMYAFNSDLLVNKSVGILMTLLVIVMGIISTAKFKGILSGVMTFKEAFSSYFITTAVGLAISTAVGILIFTIIDPDLATSLNAYLLEIAQETMIRSKDSPEEIEKQIANLSQVDNFSIASQAKSYVDRLIRYSVLGLLVGLIFKKAAPTD